MKKYEFRIKNHHSRTISLCGLAIAILLVIGCSKKTETSDISDSSIASHADSTTVTPTTPPPPAPATLSDANIIAMLSEADSSEITEAKLVLTKTKNADVKSFANMMVTDHSRMKKEKADLAIKLNITPQPPANDNEPASLTAQLSALNGTASPHKMDSIYMTNSVADHEKDANDLKDLEMKATAPELKDAIKKAEPVVQKHLDRAKAVQEKLATGTSMSGKTMEKR